MFSEIHTSLEMITLVTHLKLARFQCGSQCVKGRTHHTILVLLQLLGTPDNLCVCCRCFETVLGTEISKHTLKHAFDEGVAQARHAHTRLGSALERPL